MIEVAGRVVRRGPRSSRSRSRRRAGLSRTRRAAGRTTGCRRRRRSCGAARSPPSSRRRWRRTSGGVRSRAAAAIVESRLGGGSLYFRFTPGNLRYVDDFPARASSCARTGYLDLGSAVRTRRPAGAGSATQAAACSTRRRRSSSASAPPLFGPHLRQTLAYGRGRGRQVRRRGVRALRAEHAAADRADLFSSSGRPAVVSSVGRRARPGSSRSPSMLVAICASGTIAALRFRSLLVGARTVGLALHARRLCVGLRPRSRGPLT